MALLLQRLHRQAKGEHRQSFPLAVSGSLFLSFSVDGRKSRHGESASIAPWGQQWFLDFQSAAVWGDNDSELGHLLTGGLRWDLSHIHPTHAN